MSDNAVFSFGAAIGKPEKSFDGDGNEIWRVRARALPADIVMNGILFEEDQIRKVVHQFQGVPVLNEHPEKGIDLDNAEEMRRHYLFAHVDEPVFNEADKVMDFYMKLDPNKARSLPAGKPIVEAIERGERMDCSVSLSMQKEPVEGENYKFRARTGKPNHVSILFKEKPAAGQDQMTMVNFAAEGGIENFSMKDAVAPKHADSLHSNKDTDDAISWLLGLFRASKQKEDAGMADQTEDKVEDTKAEAPAEANSDMNEALEKFAKEIGEKIDAVKSDVDALKKAHDTEIEAFAAKDAKRRETAIEKVVKTGAFKDASELEGIDTDTIEKFASAVVKDEAKDIPADTSTAEEAPSLESFGLSADDYKQESKNAD